MLIPLRLSLMGKKGIISDKGRIKQILPEVIGNIEVSDMLRDMFFNPDSENANLFSKEEANELLFHIMKFLVGGGSLCQPVCTLQAYVKTAKLFYQKLVRMYRKHNKDIYHTTEAYRIIGDDMFGRASNLNTCILVIDRTARDGYVLHNDVQSAW